MSINQLIDSTLNNKHATAQDRTEDLRHLNRELLSKIEGALPKHIDKGSWSDAGTERQVTNLLLEISVFLNLVDEENEQYTY